MYVCILPYLHAGQSFNFQFKEADDVETMNKDLENQELKTLPPRSVASGTIPTQTSHSVFVDNSDEMSDANISMRSEKMEMLVSPVADEQSVECDISTGSSYVILPQLRPSEQALDTDTDIIENRLSQGSPISPRLSSTPPLPALPSTSSVVTAGAGIVNHDQSNENAQKSSSNASLPTLSPSRTSLVASEQVQSSVTAKSSDVLNTEEILDKQIKATEKSVEMSRESFDEVSSHKSLKASPKTSVYSLTKSPKESREVVKVSPKKSGELLKPSPKASREVMKASPKPSGDSLKTSPKESREDMKASPKPTGDSLKTSPKESCEVMKASPQPSSNSLKTSPKGSRKVVKVSPKTSGELLKTSPKASR